MSTPPFLDLPDGVRPDALITSRGALAALVAEAGGASRRSPVLLIPGFTGSKEDFIAVLGPVAAAGHPVVAFDQRGQHESRGGDDPTSYDVQVLAEDVLEVAGGLGEAVHLLGHSFGGLVARAAALTDPDAVRSLTLLDSGPAAIPHPSASNLALLAQALPDADLATIWPVKRALELDGQQPPPAHIEEFLRRRFLANNPVALLRHAEQLLTETDRVAELAALNLPLLVAFGEHDDGWPPDVQVDMARRLSATVASIPDAVHSPAAENPVATARVLTGFWASAR